VAPAYGHDSLTASVTAEFSRIFEREVAVFFVATGTAANALSLAAVSRPGGLIFCHEAAHITSDECGAPEFATGGAKLIRMPGKQAKITGAVLAATVARFPVAAVRHGQPAAVSISQTTEFGGVYRPADITVIGAAAHQAGMALHMDGARFANAVASRNASPADLTWRAGVDVMSFGGTKNGALAAEAVVFFDPAKATNMPFIRQRAGHLLSKSRLVAAQFAALFADGLWLRLAQHANDMAGQLAAALEHVPGARLAYPAPANELFVILPAERAAKAIKAGATFYEWSSEALTPDERPGKGEALYRFVTSFRSEAREIEELVAQLR
jgi:threonine aldolase